MLRKAYSKGFNGWSQLAILLGLLSVGLIVGRLISFPIWTLMTNGSPMNMEADMLKPENASASQVVQAVSVMFMFFLPTVAFAFICYRRGWVFLGFPALWGQAREKLNRKNLLIVLLIILCSIPLIVIIGKLNESIPLPPVTRAKFDALEKKYNEMVLAMVQLESWGQYFISLLIIAVLPAVTEEVLFRGGLQNLLTRWIKFPWVAIIITSILFSAIHLSWYGFFARFFLGIVLGLIFYYSQNIWLSILAHFLNNAIVVTTLFWMTRQGKPINLAAEETYPWGVGIASLILVVILVRWLIVSAPKYQYNSDDDYDSNNPFDEKDLITR